MVDYLFLTLPFAVLITMWLLSCCGPQSFPKDLDKGHVDFVSDDEFLAACSPGVRPEAAFKVRRIVAEQLGIPEHQIHPRHRFVEDLGA